MLVIFAIFRDSTYISLPQYGPIYAHILDQVEHAFTHHASVGTFTVLYYKTKQ